VHLDQNHLAARGTVPRVDEAPEYWQWDRQGSNLHRDSACYNRRHSCITIRDIDPQGIADLSFSAFTDV